MEPSEIIFVCEKVNKIVVLSEKSKLLKIIILGEGTQMTVPVDAM
jgi:hypothetical protein